MNTRKINTLSPQRRRVLASLAHGHTVSKLTAVMQRVGNINEVVRHLRRRGWDIETVKRDDMNGERYTSYELAPHQRPAARAAAAVMAGA